jgi:hypothetical protein
MYVATVSNPYVCHGAMVGFDGRTLTGFGLEGRQPSRGYLFCPFCGGCGLADAENLVAKPCGRCRGSGQVVNIWP